MNTLVDNKQISVLFFLHNYDIGEYMSGIGLRIYELAQVLSNFYEVKILCKNNVKDHTKGIKFIQYGNDWKKSIASADVIFFNDMPFSEAILYSKQLGKVVISENAVPLEHLEYDTIMNSQNNELIYKKIINDFSLQIKKSDYFIARSEIEYCTLLAVLTLSGRINYNLYSKNKLLSNLITIIPIGYNKISEINSRNSCNASSDIDLVWSGGLWNYMDIEFLLNGLDYCIGKGISPFLTFMYKGDSTPPLANYQLLQKYIQRHPSNRIFFEHNEILHSQRDAYIKRAKALICLGKNGIENKTCIRLRIRDTFLYEKPIIIDNYGATTDLVRKFEIGYVVTNFSDFHFAVTDILSNGKLYNTYCKNIKKCKQKFLLDNNIDELRTAIESLLKEPPVNNVFDDLHNKHNISLSNILYSYHSESNN